MQPSAASLAELNTVDKLGYEAFDTDFSSLLEFCEFVFEQGNKEPFFLPRNWEKRNIPARPNKKKKESSDVQMCCVSGSNFAIQKMASSQIKLVKDLGAVTLVTLASGFGSPVCYCQSLVS